MSRPDGLSSAFLNGGPGRIEPATTAEAVLYLLSSGYNCDILSERGPGSTPLGKFIKIEEAGAPNCSFVKGNKL